MRVERLYRYPVKSLQGESLSSARVDRRGLAGDRVWALVGPDGALASGKPTRRFRKVPGLMLHRSHIEDDVVVITLADGRTVVAGEPSADTVAEELAGEGWRLRREGRQPNFDQAAVSLITTASLAAFSRAAGREVEAARVRPNIVIDAGSAPAFAEDAWVGRELVVGGVRLRVAERTTRCVMTNQAQAGLPARRDVLRTIGEVNDACAGVYADVVETGLIRVGDAVEVL